MKAIIAGLTLVVALAAGFGSSEWLLPTEAKQAEIEEQYLLPTEAKQAEINEQYLLPTEAKQA